MVIMKRTIFLLALMALLLSNCQNHSMRNRLAEVDSLIVIEEFDSAYHLITTELDSIGLSPEDQAYYNLLRVQTAYQINKPLPLSDSILDDVISYYEKHVAQEKLADAYYYKARGLNSKHNYQESIVLYKKAEKLAEQFGNIRQLFKIYEGIAYVNRKCGKYDLQYIYAKKALEAAQVIGHKNWMAYSYYNLAFANMELGFEDSALIFLSKIPPFIKYVSKNEKPLLLSSVGYLLAEKQPKEAKKYLLESLKYQELTATYEYLAEICYEEGNYDEAYCLWKKALIVQDPTPKDVTIHNIIEYDMERGKTDSICERINEIIAIRDSIDAKLKNDTIKDLQTRFDHEVEMREKDRAVIKWQWVAIALVILLLVGVIYYLVRKYQNRIQLQKYQMQIHDYMEQIRALSGKKDQEAEIDRLNKEIKKIMDEKSPRLAQGRILYDKVVANENMGKWRLDDVEKFIEYYTATNYRVVNRLQSIPRRDELTPHRLLYLILVEMKKTDQQICFIQGITKECLRVYRFRTQPIEKEETSEESDESL